MSMNNVGRPSAPEITVETTSFKTLLGGKGLLQSEKLIFEKDDYGRTGVDFADVAIDASDLDGLLRNDLSLPGLTEPEAMRHYVRLSQKNHAIDLALYPLGAI